VNIGLVNQGKTLGGLYVHSANGGTYNDFIVEECTFANLSGNAFRFTWESSPRHTGVVIRNNDFHDIGCMPCIHSATINAVFEHNVAYRCHLLGGFGGMWNSHSNGSVFQFNEWYEDGRAEMDGTAFDPDVGSSQTTIQYNYIHDTKGGLVCFYSPETQKPDILRYNLCAKMASGSSGIIRFGHTTHVYNNVFYFTSFVPGGGKNAFDGFNSSIHCIALRRMPASLIFGDDLSRRQRAS
jgi:hypothetical protein